MEQRRPALLSFSRAFPVAGVEALRSAQPASGGASMIGILVFIVVLGSLTRSAWAQGFMVKPMRMDVNPLPASTVEIPLEIRNTSGDDITRQIDLRLVKLSQTSQGHWRIIEPGSDEDEQWEDTASCYEWVGLGQETVELPPLGVVQVPVTLQVPAQARGVYLAGLLAETQPDPNARGMRVRVRFLVPIVVEIRGRPVRQQIELQGVDMTFRGNPNPQARTTLASLVVANLGRTYSRLEGKIEVQALWRDRWRKVMTAEPEPIGIMPGVTLHLTSDLERRLPSGRYKLIGTLYVDGRRLKPLEQEIDFEGDPSVTQLAIDSALLLDPLEVQISGRPGAARTALLRVENASEDAVEIDTAVMVPPTLEGVALDEMRGTELACTQWLSVVPAKFTIRGGATQNIRVLARLPREGMVHPSYYGLIQLHARYPDGQSAGRVAVMARVRNEDLEAVVKGQVVKANLAASSEAGRYVVQTRFSNVGEIDFSPMARAILTTGRGTMIKQVHLEGDEGTMLPLEIRDFAGVLDFTDIEPGVYALQVQLDLPEGKGVTEQLPVRVEEENGAKVVTLIQPTEVAEAPSDGGEGQP